MQWFASKQKCSWFESWFFQGSFCVELACLSLCVGGGFSRYFSFLPQSKDMQIELRSTGDSKMWVWVVVCLCMLNLLRWRPLYPGCLPDVSRDWLQIRVSDHKTLCLVSEEKAIFFLLFAFRALWALQTCNHLCLQVVQYMFSTCRFAWPVVAVFFLKL